MRLACDLDGPVYPFTQVVRQYIHETYGRPLESMPDQQAWDFAAEWGLTKDELSDYVMEAINAGELWWKGKPIPGSIAALNRLAEDHEIVVVTTRFWGGVDHEEATRHWLDHTGFPYDDLIITADKTAVKFDLLIDDGPHNILAAQAAGRDVLIWNETYNRGLEGPRAYSWLGVEQYIASWWESSDDYTPSS